jgi:hypothetical protein
MQIQTTLSFGEESARPSTDATSYGDRRIAYTGAVLPDCADVLIVRVYEGEARADTTVAHVQMTCGVPKRRHMA